MKYVHQSNHHRCCLCNKKLRNVYVGYDHLRHCHKDDYEENRDDLDAFLEKIDEAMEDPAEAAAEAPCLPRS